MGVASTEWSEDDWASEQAKDEKLKHWRDYLQGTCGPLDDSMAREKAVHGVSPKGVVKRLWVPHDKASTKEAQWLIKVPRQMQDEVLEWFHNRSGHSGVTALTEMIRKAGLTWDGYYASVANRLKHCEICQEHMVPKVKEAPMKATMQSVLIGKRVLVVDFIGPLPETKQGNKYMILSVSLDDMWPAVEAVREQTTDVVIKHLFSRAKDEGVSDMIVSDLGSPLVSKAAIGYYADMGLESKTSTAHNHQAIGAAEAEVKNVKETLKRIRSEYEVMGKEVDWDQLIETTLMIRRAQDRTDPKMSPFKARFGKEMRLPAHLKFGADTSTLAAEKQQELMERARKLADEAAEKQKARFDIGRVEVSYNIGEKVFLKDHYRGALDGRRTGPFEIVDKKSDWSYELGECDGGPKLGRRHRVVNVRDLMKYMVAETKVDMITDHRHDDIWEFLVRWQDGDVTWEPVEHLYDVEKSGQIVYNDKLVDYAATKNLKLAAHFIKGGDVVK
jgi:hypothetical protein